MFGVMFWVMSACLPPGNPGVERHVEFLTRIESSRAYYWSVSVGHQVKGSDVSNLFSLLPRFIGRHKNVEHWSQVASDLASATS
jgi:hypothetical protein